VRIGLDLSAIQRSRAASRLTAWWPQRDLRRTNQNLHFPVQSMAVQASVNADSESPEAGPVLRLRAGVVGAGPSGPGMAQQKPGTYCGAFTAVLHAIRKLMTPNGAPAKPGGVFSI
jgi:hypothetical protein